jgi:DNA-binding MarR family transcriptional regulator
MADGPAVLRSIERAAQLLSRELARRLGGGLSEAEAHLLFHLEHLPRGTVPSVRELQRAFGLRPSTLTAVIDRLERQGLVERRLNPADRRSFLIAPTPSARKTIRHVSAVLDELESAVRGRVTAAQLAGFDAVLAALEDALG